MTQMGVPCLIRAGSANLTAFARDLTSECFQKVCIGLNLHFN
jgi:hypothetical protein